MTSKRPVVEQGIGLGRGEQRRTPRSAPRDTFVEQHEMIGLTPPQPGLPQLTLMPAIEGFSKIRINGALCSHGVGKVFQVDDDFADVLVETVHAVRVAVSPPSP